MFDLETIKARNAKGVSDAKPVRKASKSEERQEAAERRFNNQRLAERDRLNGRQ